MPPVVTIPSSDEHEDSDMPAFKVLNQDDLPDNVIVGEAIFKPLPFGNNDSRKEKPNGIVYPTRRYISSGHNGNLEDNHKRNFTKSNGYIYQQENNYSNMKPQHQQQQNNLKKKYSNSHGNLNNVNVAKRKPEYTNNVDINFTKTLDAKLRRLQKEEKMKQTNQLMNQYNHHHQQPPPPPPHQLIRYQVPSAALPKPPHYGSQQQLQQRKPFMTTVKKGEFLRPPPEMATLLGLPVEPAEEEFQTIKREEARKLYSYASRPRVLNRNPIVSVPPVVKNDAHIARCENVAKTAAALTAQIVGIAGLNGGEPLFEEVAKKDAVTNVQTTTTFIARRNGPPLPYANLMFERRVVRGSNFAQTKVQEQGGGDGESAAARAAEARRRNIARRKAHNQQARAAAYRLGSPPAVSGRRHEKVQTEQYLEELWNDPPKTDICTQTDLFLDRPVSPMYVPACTGVDAETQIYPGDLFDFDMEVQPILEVLVGKTIEQALIEVLEEEELAALREQQRRFMQMRAADTAEAQRLEERERRMQAERDIRMAESQAGIKIQEEMEERIAAAVLTQGYLADMLPQILEGLEESGFLGDNIRADVDDAFMPWLMKEVTQEMNAMVGSRDILTDIVREILEERDELYKALYAESPNRPESEEEEGPTLDDLELAEHMKLKAGYIESSPEVDMDMDTDRTQTNTNKRK